MDWNTAIRSLASLTKSNINKNDIPTLDELRADLVHQLGIPDELDWDYFVETAMLARKAANKENRNMTPEEKY